jgi:hypothetical protein
MRRTTTAEVRPDAGKATRLSASGRSTGDFDHLPRTGARFAVAQDVRRDEHGLTTTRNSENVGLASLTEADND